MLEKISVETENGRVPLVSLGQVVIKDPQTIHINLYDETVILSFNWKLTMISMENW
jgi:ribosome recycling factor